MAIWYLALKAGAPLPRRLVYVVDRRAVVDQATEEANKIKAWAEQPGHGKLPISTLRGQYADNRDWLEDPAAPAIIRTEEHTSELQSLMRNSYAVFCLKQKKKTKT